MEPIVLRAGEGEAVPVAGNDIIFKAEGKHTGGALGITEYTAGPGSPGPPPHVLVPPGNVHTFCNPSSEPARFLSLFAPAGFEQYLKELSAALDGGPVDPAVVARVSANYDIEVP